MNYQIIKNENLLREFINWLPELTDQEKFYCCLFSRSKYCKDENGVNTMPHIKSDKSQLKRFVTDKKRMFEKLKQLEVEIGAYKHNDLPVPQQALAVYITVNPRNMWRATFNSIVKLTTAIRDDNKLMNPHQEVLSEIQRTKSRTCYVDFDLDLDNKYNLDLRIGEVLNFVNEEAVTFLETRGGMHILVDPNKVTYEFKNKFYQNLSSLPGIDQTGDQMIPIVGCTQGDFIPHFIKI